jgi:hypothetical protein
MNSISSFTDMWFHYLHRLILDSKIVLNIVDIHIEFFHSIVVYIDQMDNPLFHNLNSNTILFNQWREKPLNYNMNDQLVGNSLHVYNYHVSIRINFDTKHHLKHIPSNKKNFFKNYFSLNSLTWFFSDEQLNKHRHTCTPFSIIQVFPFKQINVLHPEMKKKKKIRIFNGKCLITFT